MSEFAFQWPSLLALLLLVIPLALLLGYARRQRLKLIHAMGGGYSTHHRLRDILRVAAFVLLVLSMARPGHSPSMESTSRTGRDVVFALDVSQSMLAEDATPSRLEVAKQGIRDALDSFSSQRVGLLVYAGSSSILCPLTYDYEFVRYMLDQAHPRSVDFGGTNLQSAVEKAADQVFISGRDGLQDLVVLTDGGDHGSNMSKVIEVLEANQTSVLVVGLGNPNHGSPIPIQGVVGDLQWMENEGQTVYTKLDDASLRAFSLMSVRVDYRSAGVKPFNLGQIYREYAAEKQVDSLESESGVMVYQEAAVFFVIPALFLLLISECWGTRGLQLGSATLWLVLLIQLPFEASAADLQFKTDFNNGVSLFEAGSLKDAEKVFGLLYENVVIDHARPDDLAALQLNRGLCLFGLSESQSKDSPTLALNYAKDAQLAFLSAKRYNPNLKRAGIRLESTAQFINLLQVAIDAQLAASEAIQEQLEALVKRLQELLEAQRRLRQKSNAKDVSRKPIRSVRNAPPTPVVAPKDADESSRLFVETQGELHLKGLTYKMQMQVIDRQLAMPDTESIMSRPLSLMSEILASQLKAKESFVDWSGWPAARADQLVVEEKIEEILELLADRGQQDFEEGEDWDEFDQEYDYMEGSEESVNRSEPMLGDFAVGSDMQELPAPNYSVEDILLEEQGSLQFRQQRRASANASKVEKDY